MVERVDSRISRPSKTAAYTSIERRRKSVWGEVERWKKHPPKGFTWHINLNNFSQYLPWSKSQYGSFYIDLAYRVGHLHVTHRESSEQIRKELQLGKDAYRKLHSQKYYDQTPKQLFDQIMSSIQANYPEITLEEIDRLQTEHHKYDHLIWYKGMPKNEERKWERELQKGIKAQHALYEYALPVFVELRARGYTTYDLSA